MAIHNKSHHNHALMSINKMRKDKTLKNKTAKDFMGTMFSYDFCITLSNNVRILR